jgi:hypothetical protein
MPPQVPDAWKPRLKEYLRDRYGEDREALHAGDFRCHVQIRFPDGSFVFLQHAFYLLDRAAGQVAVFSEHCGYHVFPLGGAELDLLGSEWSDVGE